MTLAHFAGMGETFPAPASAGRENNSTEKRPVPRLGD